MTDIIQLMPNKWGSEKRLIALAGLTKHAIKSDREKSWLKAGSIAITQETFSQKIIPPHSYNRHEVEASWNHRLKRAGIRYRKAYESRHTFACWALSAGANPSFIANQMGHTNVQMVFSIYGKWMSDQIALLNHNFDFTPPHMPHKKVAAL